MQFGIKTTEFKNTLENLGYHDIVFVRDESKTWYNKQGVFEKNLNHIRNNLSRETNIFLGSSMGAFGAILYSSYIPECKKVICFSPQIHIDTKLTKGWDDRYLDTIGHLKHFEHPSVVYKFRDDIPYKIIYGGNSPIDAIHINLIPKKNNIKIYRVEEAGHNVPGRLKKENKLVEYLEKFLSED